MKDAFDQASPALLLELDHLREGFSRQVAIICGLSNQRLALDASNSVLLPGAAYGIHIFSANAETTRFLVWAIVVVFRRYFFMNGDKRSILEASICSRHSAGIRMFSRVRATQTTTGCFARKRILKHSFSMGE